MINEVNNIKNYQELMSLYCYLNSEDQANEVCILSDAQNLVIDGAREKYKKGDFFSNEFVDEEINQWFSE